MNTDVITVDFFTLEVPTHWQMFRSERDGDERVLLMQPNAASCWGGVVEVRARRYKSYGIKLSLAEEYRASGLTTKPTRRRKRRLGARHERKAEVVGGRVQLFVVMLLERRAAPFQMPPAIAL